jgi:hypothetical protein
MTRGKEALLFEKRSKNFGALARALSQPKTVIKQKFWFFFAKKNCFPGCFGRCGTRLASVMVNVPLGLAVSAALRDG